MLDTWYEWLRLLNLVLCIFCNYKLSLNFFNKTEVWSKKTRRLWFALTTWCLVGAVISLLQLARDVEYSVGTLYLTIGTVATLQFLYTKGPWGTDDF